MGGQRLQVEPSELHAAASTLSSVIGSLDQRHDLDVSAVSCGSPALSAAVSDFCQQAGTAATAFSAAVGAASATVDSSGTAYSGTESSIATSFGGPH